MQGHGQGQGQGHGHGHGHGQGQRRLPRWYLDKVAMASEVWAGAPDKVDLSMPHVDRKPNAGQGVTAPRVGRLSIGHSG